MHAGSCYLSCSFQEVIYQRALEIELKEAGVGFDREFSMPIYYKGYNIGKRRVDSFIEKKVSVELKALTYLEPVHFNQAKNYLEAYNLEVGLLINFGSPSLQFKRLQNKSFISFLLNQ
jgi:GxxExxY protein